MTSATLRCLRVAAIATPLALVECGMFGSSSSGSPTNGGATQTTGAGSNGPASGGGDSQRGLPVILRSGSSRLGRPPPCHDRFFARTRDIPGNPQPHLTKRFRRRRFTGRADQTFGPQKLRRVDPTAPGAIELGSQLRVVS